ncbi:ankyrin repeat domain-containing protein 45 [Megalops cyprinoides]|uniref:ankyrin repeat domain-containing protein 45 n=1 Tax=Megalops cyprinoides TaxID=118141 RepID=UPI0018655D30|nr:ankyrin repeat domain-containing protein 45 [Megalops cyprinoides]
MELRAENSVLSCCLSGDAEGLQRVLESKSNSDEGETVDLLSEKDDVGRNALFMACMLGRSNVVRELVKYGGNVNELTARGYSPLHCAAVWGQLDTVKTLVDLGADMHTVNFRGEKAKEVACRYSKTDCAEFLAWAEAKQDLQSYISQVRQTISDPEKVHGKLTKEEKNICMNTCSAKADWIQNAKNPSKQDFIEQKQHLEDTISPVLAKLTLQSEATAKHRKN